MKLKESHMNIEIPPQESSRKSVIDSGILRLIAQSMVTKVLMLLLRLGRNAILARALGPSARGLFALISALPELISAIGNLGVATSAGYYTAQPGANIRSITGSVSLFVVIVGSLLGALTYGLLATGLLIKDEDTLLADFMWIVALCVPLVLFKMINSNLLLSLGRVGNVNLLRLIESLVPLVLFLLLWYVFKLEALAAAIWSWFITFVLVFGISIIYWGLYHIAPRLPSAIFFKQLLRFGIKSHFDTLFQTMLLRIDYLFVGALLGAGPLGYYAMATAAAELLLIVPESIALPLSSVILGRQKEKSRYTPLSLKIILLCMSVSALALAGLGETLIRILFGQTYLPSYEPMLWLLPGLIGLSICGILRLEVLAHGKPGTVSLIAGAAVAVNLVLNSILIPIMGVNGAALSSTIAYWAGSLMLFRYYMKLTGLKVSGILLFSSDEKKLLATFFARFARLRLKQRG